MDNPLPQASCEAAAVEKWTRLFQFCMVVLIIIFLLGCEQAPIPQQIQFSAEVPNVHWALHDRESHELHMFSSEAVYYANEPVELWLEIRINDFALDVSPHHLLQPVGFHIRDIDRDVNYREHFQLTEINSGSKDYTKQMYRIDPKDRVIINPDNQKMMLPPGRYEWSVRLQGSIERSVLTFEVLDSAVEFDRQITQWQIQSYIFELDLPRFSGELIINAEQQKGKVNYQIWPQDTRYAVHPDDEQLLAVEVSGLIMKVDLAKGTIERWLLEDDTFSDSNLSLYYGGVNLFWGAQPHFSPNGEELLFYTNRQSFGSTSSSGQWKMKSLADGQEKLISDKGNFFFKWDSDALYLWTPQEGIYQFLGDPDEVKLIRAYGSDDLFDVHFPYMVTLSSGDFSIYHMIDDEKINLKWPEFNIVAFEINQAGTHILGLFQSTESKRVDGIGWIELQNFSDTIARFTDEQLVHFKWSEDDKLALLLQTEGERGYRQQMWSIPN